MQPLTCSPPLSAPRQARQAAAQLAALQQQVAASQAADRVALEGWSAMEAELGQARATAEVASAECARLTQVRGWQGLRLLVGP